MSVVKLTAKNQATVPRDVRNLLHLGPGDSVAYEIKDDNTVIIRKASQLDMEYLRALQGTLEEWASEEDERAFRHL